jgi:ATP-dependent helicase/nuclease subunit A
MNKNNENSLTFPEVVVVEASAGSGKTYALAKRYLQLLLNPGVSCGPIALRTILAITFTNKATVEMKERILELLKKIVLDSFDSKKEEAEILNLIGLQKDKAKEKCARLMDEIIRHYNFFQIQTIDSFINALLLGCALNIERSASFTIKRDYSQHLSYCLDLVFEEAVTNKDTFDFLEEFLEHYLFVENRTGWFPKDDILGLIKSLFKLSNKYGRLFEVFQGQAKDIIKKKKYIYSQIKELAFEFPPGMNKTAQTSIVNFIEKSNEIFDLRDLPDKFQRPYLPMNKGVPSSPDYEKKWKKIHKDIGELVNLEATLTYNPYVKLFLSLLDFFGQVSKREDILFLEELNRKARLLFDESGITVAEVYYRLATRFKHYLIDEFQDTSLLQWKNLDMMVEEALSTGGSLFYVGDKKQAIYRFRGGEAKLFDDVKAKFSHFNVKPSSLTKNWRSQKEIVEFNNKVFSKINLIQMLNLCSIAKELEGDDEAIGEIVEIFKDAIQEHKKENDCGYVKVERIDEKNQEERDEIIKPKLIKLIKELKTRGFNYEDIAILTRDNSEVELVTSWLLSQHLPVESEKTLNAIQNPLIKELISFLAFLHSPIDDLSFASFILGQIFSRASGIPTKDITAFLINLKKENKLNGGISLYRLFRQKYPQAWSQYIDEFFKTIGFISPYELTVNIYQAFRLYDNFAASQAFFMKFLELIKTNEDEHVGMGEFLSYLKDAPQEDLYVNVTHSDSVKILTIHKSKGLEFGVVIIPFLRMEISPETGGKGTSAYCLEGPNQDLGLLRITKNHRAYSKALQKVYIQSYKKACIDELNNIYVALTRPQFELYIFIPKKSGSANNKARFLIPEPLSEQGAKTQYKKKRKDTCLLMDIKPCEYRNWLKLLRDEFFDAAAVSNPQEILEGNIMHMILSRVANCVNKDIEVMLKESLEYTKAQFPFIEDFSVYIKTIEKLFKNEELKDVFCVEQGEVYCEKEVANRFGDLKRIDRLIVKDDEVWIIDYKSSKESSQKHYSQIKEYIQIVTEIYPGKRARGFLIYLDELAMEEVT